MIQRCDAIRSDIMNFFRNDEDCANIHSLSLEDRYEIMLLLCEHSDTLEIAVKRAIKNYTKREDMNVYEYLTRFDQRQLLDIEEFGFFAFVDEISEINISDIPYSEGVLRKAASRMWEFREMSRLNVGI